jgi:hypothetical protein
MFTTSPVYWQLLSSTRMGFDMFLTRFDKFQPFCVFSHFLVYSLVGKYRSRVRKNQICASCLLELILSFVWNTCMYVS